MSKVLISGGSGLIGSDLIEFLAKAGYSAHILTRNPSNKTANRYHWNPAAGTIDLEAFEGVTHVVNLAGSSIIKGRWTSKRKEILRSSRIKSTSFLVDTIFKEKIDIKGFISASAMGYFGNSAELKSDDSKPGDDFLAQLCVDWENAAMSLNKNTPVSIVRIGLYLSNRGGFYSIINRLSAFYIASAFGSGKQYVNYTHKDEFGKLILNLIKGELKHDKYNAVGAKALTLNELIKKIARANGKRVLLPNVPSFLLKLVLGEASSALLHSYKVESPKLKSSKFYTFSSADEAIEQLNK